MTQLKKQNIGSDKVSRKVKKIREEIGSCPETQHFMGCAIPIVLVELIVHAAWKRRRYKTSLLPRF